LKDTIYYVQPWNKNTENSSINQIDNIPGYHRSDVVAQYHIHPNFSDTSYSDAVFCAQYGKPVYILGANGNMWEVSYMLVNRYHYLVIFYMEIITDYNILFIPF
jgi:hypothetical protein